MSPDHDLRRRREELVQRHIEVEAAGDADAVVATFARPRYDLVYVDQVLEGAEAVAGRVRSMAEALPDAQMDVLSLRHCDDAVIVETRTHGHHTGEMFGVGPTGRPFSIRGVAIFRFEGPDLVEELVYYDRLTIIEQIRASGSP